MNKRRTKILSLLLMVIMVMNLTTIAFAATEHNFEDVPENEYYCDSVYKMYNAGIVTGYSDVEFGPKRNITKAEVLALVSRSIKVDTDSLKTDDVWYSGIANWAIKQGLVNKNDDLGKAASREDMAFYICKAFSIAQTKEKYCVDTNSVYVNSLVEAEIVYGQYTTENGKIYYGAKDPISRADTCVIIDRALTKIGKPLAYVEVDLDNDFVRLPTSELVVLSNNPYTIEEFADIWTYMADNSLLEYYVGTCTEFDNIKQLVSIVTNGVRRLRETRIWLDEFYTKTSIQLSNTEDGSYDVWLIAAKESTDEDYLSNLKFISQETDNIILELLNDGRIDPEYSLFENAKAVYEYVVNFLEYDYNGVYNSIYDALKYNKATCVSYTSLYNYILYKLGFEVEAQYGLAGDNAIIVNNNRNHVWSKIKVKDQEIYIDTTWGDNSDNIVDYRYFWVTKDELLYLDKGREFLDYLDFIEYNKSGV